MPRRPGPRNCVLTVCCVLLALVTAGSALGDEGAGPTPEAMRSVAQRVAELSDDRPEVRRNAAWALSQLGLSDLGAAAASVVPDLVAAFERDAEWEVRAYALVSLIEIEAGAPRTTEVVAAALLRGLRDPHHMVRAAGVFGLRELGPRAGSVADEAVPVLLDIARDPELHFEDAGAAELAVVDLGLAAAPALIDELRKPASAERAPGSGAGPHLRGSLRRAELVQALLTRIARSAKRGGAPPWWLVPGAYRREGALLLVLLGGWFVAASRRPQRGAGWRRALSIALVAAPAAGLLLGVVAWLYREPWVVACLPDRYWTGLSFRLASSLTLVVACAVAATVAVGARRTAGRRAGPAPPRSTSPAL